MGSLAGAAAQPDFFGAISAEGEEPKASTGIIGMYVHQHWPYNHHYSARTWTVGDYQGYSDGLTKLGYNTMLIWPLLETMPSPLTQSDRANLDKIAKVIDMLHYARMNSPVPQRRDDDKEAAKAPFSRRYFFYCNTRVNPADLAAMRKVIAWRAELLRSLTHIDGIVPCV